MTVYVMEPRDTLVLRDGRPQAGTALQMRSIPLPYPQAIAGFFRTRSCVDKNGAFVIPRKDKEEKASAALERLKKQEVRGPWLARLNEKGDVAEHLLPAPRDAVLFRGDDDFYLVRLGLRADAQTSEGEYVSGALKKDGKRKQYLSAFLAEPVKDKPARSVPLWTWGELSGWLSSPENKRNICQIDGNDKPHQILGAKLPQVSLRMGLKIDRETSTADKGFLFSTEHREYFCGDGASRADTSKLALLASTNAQNVREGAVPFAGKRRTVFLRRSNAEVPAPPNGLLKKIAESGRLRMMLLTPGWFEEGWRPKWLLKQGLGANLRGAIVPRPEVVSGWDFHLNKPKPTRRLVPAGSIYFLELKGDRSERLEWLRSRWWMPVSDDEQSRFDGFGLAVFGVDRPVSGGRRDG